MSTPFLHASLIGPKCVQSSLQRESCVSTEQPHGLSPSQSTWPKYQATNSRVLLKGARFPQHGRSYHLPNTGQAQGDPAHPFPLGTKTLLCVSYGHWIRTGFCSRSPNHTYATRTCHSSFANFVLKLATYLLTPPDHQPMTEDQRFNLMMPFSSLLQCGPTYMTTTTHAGLSHKCL